jgi:hypothetical protein
MPDTPTLETPISTTPGGHAEQDRHGGDRRDSSTARQAAAVEAAYILEAIRG